MRGQREKREERVPKTLSNVPPRARFEKAYHKDYG